MLKLSLAAGTLFLVLHSNVASAQGASIGGRVVNAQGTVIANADITLRSIPPAGMPARMPMPGQDNGERTTQSRADGTFSFTQVAPGQYVLFADRTGFERYVGADRRGQSAANGLLRARGARSARR